MNRSHSRKNLRKPPVLAAHRIVVLLASSMLAASAFAAPTSLPVQGRMASPTGGPVADGDYAVKFALYDTEKAAVAVYSEAVLALKVSGGMFAHRLGTSDPLKPLDDGLFRTAKARWLGVTVGGDAELPRVALSYLPYAHLATHAQTAALAAIASDLQCTGCITSATIKPSAVKAAHIANGAIGSAHLSTGAIASAHIADKAIKANHIPAGEIGPSHLADGTVTKLGFVKGPHYTDKQALDAVLKSKQVALVDKDGAVTANAFIGDGSKLTGVIVKTPNIGDLIGTDGKSVVRLQRGQPFTIVGESFGKAPVVLVHNAAVAKVGIKTDTKIAATIDTHIETGTVAISVRDLSSGRRSNAVVVPFESFLAAGTGSDGPLLAKTGTVQINNYYPVKSSVSQGETSVEVTDAKGLTTGDEVLIHQTTGAGVGSSQWRRVTVKGNVLSFGDALPVKFTVGGKSKVQVVRVPQYTTVTVSAGATVAAKKWDGATGGIVAFRATGKVSISGTVSANGAGLRGGSAINHTGSGTRSGKRGESQSGDFNDDTFGTNSGAGGGGGSTTNNDQNGPGGGGGGHGTSGASGQLHSSTGTGGQGGAAQGNKTLTVTLLGAGGGSGAITNEDSKNLPSGAGGAGGGFVFIGAKSIALSGGTITAAGTNGGTAPKGSADDEYGGGGGGAGGTIWLRAETCDLGSGKVKAPGGSKGLGIVNNSYNYGGDPNDGGAGGVGRIRVDGETITGTTVPSHYAGALE